jgi:hypothetical protein
VPLTSRPPGMTSFPERETILSFMVSATEMSFTAVCAVAKGAGVWAFAVRSFSLPVKLAGGCFAPPRGLGFTF